MRVLTHGLNRLYSGGIASMAGAVAIGVSAFGMLWAFGEALGVQGSPRTLVLLLTVSALVPVATMVFAPFRWALLAWLVGRELAAVRHFRPDLIVGVGPGGAITAGMIAKSLAASSGYEPAVAVIDRRFTWGDDRILTVSLEEAGQFTPDLSARFPKVLLATSEVHTGNTMRSAHERFAALGVEMKSFSICANPGAAYVPDVAVVRSDQTGLLPWSDAPDRIYRAPQ